MNGVNKVILEGNISKIDTKEVNGKKVTDLQLAVLTVGKALRVEGEITADIYEKDGKNHKNVYVSMSKFEFTQGQKKEQGKEKQVDEPERVFG